MLSSEEIFNDFVTSYQDALDKSGCKHKLKYQRKMNTTSNKKNKKNKKHHLVQPTIQQKGKNQHRKNISESNKEPLPTTS